MKREIEFRGLTQHEICWIYGMPRFFKSGRVEIFDFDETFYVRPETICQYIGLQDKKGNKIFEGDIVNILHPCWTAKCSVEFLDGAFFFIERNNPVNNAWVRADKFQKQQWEIEIIGNIFQTPELLEH